MAHRVLLVLVVASACGGSPARPVESPRAPAATPQASQDTSLDASTVFARIQSVYMPGIKRCYKSRLKKDATAQGKVALAFTVSETGRAVQATAHGFDHDIDACISAQMASWQFAIPRDQHDVATPTQFAITLRLVPD